MEGVETSARQEEWRATSNGTEGEFAEQEGGARGTRRTTKTELELVEDNAGELCIEARVSSMAEELVCETGSDGKARGSRTRPFFPR